MPVQFPVHCGVVIRSAVRAGPQDAAYLKLAREVSDTCVEVREMSSQPKAMQLRPGRIIPLHTNGSSTLCSAECLALVTILLICPSRFSYLVRRCIRRWEADCLRTLCPLGMGRSGLLTGRISWRVIGDP